MADLDTVLNDVQSLPDELLQQVAAYVRGLAAGDAAAPTPPQPDRRPAPGGPEHYLKKELYESFHENPRIFDFLQQAALDGLWYWDLENPQEEWLSPRLKEVLGYLDEDVPNNSSWWQERIFPEDLAVAMENFHRHCADPNHPYDQIVRYKHKDGSTVCIRCRGLAIFNANGKAVRMLGAHTDITAIRNAEQRLRAVREAAPDMYVQIGRASGLIDGCNGNLAQTLGFDRSELIGRPWQQLCEPQSIPVLDAALRSIAGGRHVKKRELTLRTKTGEPVPIALEASPAPDSAEDASQVQLWCRDLRHLKSISTIALVIDLLPQGVVLVDQRGRIALANEAAAEVTGYPSEELVGLRFETLIAAPRGAGQAGGPRPGFDGAGSLPCGPDLTVVQKNGRQIPAEVRLAEAHTTEGAYVLAIFMDLTERHTMGAALRESEERFRLLSEATPQLVWTCRPDGYCDYLNTRWTEYTGIPANQHLGDRWLNRIHPADKERTMLSWQRAVATTSAFETDYRIQAKDGSYRWFQARALPWLTPQGAVSRWIGCSTDIDDQKRIAAEIRTLNEDLEHRVAARTAELANKNRELSEIKGRLEAILNAASRSSIISTDTNGLITIFNSGAEKMLGYEAGEVVGICTPQILHVESECLNRSLDLTVQQGRPVEGFEVFVWNARQGGAEEREWTYVRKDGSTLDVRLAVSAVRNAEGEITGFLGIATDITNRKALERELRDNNLKLQIETQRAEAANRAKSEFLAATSHEIRTPMNAILGMADLLSDTALDPEQRKYVEVFRRAGQNLLALISDVLDLSKIESGQFHIEQIEFELSEVVNRCMELIRTRIRIETVELILDLAPDLPNRLIGDPDRLQQILINLLGNAAKFTETGEVVLKVDRQECDESCRIGFAVSDTGVGIAPDKLQVIFDDFTQADSSITRKYGGTGLGLGIAKRLIERMDGKLTASSEPGKGSTFAFSAVFARSDSPEVRRAVVVDDFVGLRALVIDDNATNCLIFRKYMISWGFESTECHSAREGLAVLVEAGQQQRPYSILLLDMRMPDTDGLAAIEMFRRVAGDLPIITLSSDDRPGDATRSQERGAAAYATKPISRTNLLRLVRKALGTTDQREASAKPAASPSEGQAPAEGRPIQILVAEDSLDNQALVEAYLKNSPYTLKFVLNGQEAVEEFQAAAYDMILMDVQMPVMDGLTATRQIRALEQQQSRPAIPILALSANAFEHDRTASLIAGCDVHLSKPVSKTHLLEQIEKYLPAAPVSRAPSPVEVPPEIQQLSQTYLRRRRHELVEMRELLARSDCGRLRTLGHNMKGAATGYGFPELAAIGASLERNATRASAEDLAADIRSLSDCLDQLQPKQVESEVADS